MIADQVQEGVLPDEVAGAQNGVAVAQRFGLGDEAEAAGMIAGYPRVRCLVAWRNDNSDFVDTGAQGFFDYDAEDRLFDAIAVDEGLQRQAPLAGSGGCDHRLTDFHVGSGPLDIMPVEAQNRTWIAMPASKYYLSG